MISDTALIILLFLSACILPGCVFYSNWKLGRDHKRKMRQIADLIEKAADDQIKAKDGPK